MMKRRIPLVGLLPLLLLGIFSSCRQENAATIRNVRFDPKLLNQVQDGDAPSCTNYTYYYSQEPKSLGTVYTKKVSVAFAENLTHEDRKAVIARYGFVKALGQPVRTGSAMLYALQLENGLNCKQVENALKVLQADEQIAYAAPFFQTTANGGTGLIGLSNELMVTLQDNVSDAALNQLADAVKAKVVMGLGRNIYLLEVDKHAAGNALVVANKLREQSSVVNAEPDFILSLERTVTPNMPTER